MTGALRIAATVEAWQCGGDPSMLEPLVAGLDDLALKRSFGGLLAYAMGGGELFGRYEDFT